MRNYQEISSKETFKKVMEYIGKYKWYLFASILLAGVTVVLTLYAPILFGNAIDGIVEKGNVDFDLILGYLKTIVLVIICTSVFTWIMNVINNRIAYYVVKDIRAKAIRQIQVLPLKYLDGQSTGDLVGRVIADTDQVSDGLLLGLTQLFTGVLTILGTLYFMISKSIEITILVIVMTPISFFVAKFIATHSYTMFRKQTETRGRQTALIEEMIGNQKVVQAFNYQETSSKRFQEINEELKQYSQKAIFFSSLTNPSTRAVNSVIYAFVALLGAYLILHGKLTIGGLSVLLSYANQYMKPFNDISSVVTELQNALACANRIFTLIEEEAEEKEKEKDGELPECHGNVAIENISFRYVEKKPLIENFSLTVKPGTRVALVGPTGCGKTTFINLLMRFYDVRDGAIKIEGVDIRDVKRHSLRSAWGMVLQETWLKNGTIRENLLFGNPDATEEDLIIAAKEAHSWSFIRRLPNGLDTMITEDSLSAGQKQLLCITRVMLALPEMLILDEATSSIDTRTEQEIQIAFDKLMKGRTTFVVAHRLSTIQDADIILVMKDGKIIEQGNHKSLMAQNGFYTNLYNSQFAGVD